MNNVYPCTVSMRTQNRIRELLWIVSPGHVFYLKKQSRDFFFLLHALLSVFHYIVCALFCVVLPDEELKLFMRVI